MRGDGHGQHHGADHRNARIDGACAGACACRCMADRRRIAEATGHLAVDMAVRQCAPSSFLSVGSFENAMRVCLRLAGQPMPSYIWPRWLGAWGLRLI